MLIVLLCAVVAVSSAKEHFDLDGDGIVGIDEFAVVSFAENGVSKGELGQIVKESDVNRNQRLEGSELEKAKQILKRISQEKASEWLKEHDSDKNGRLSREELIAAISKKVGVGRKETQEMWHLADKDRDGVITYAESVQALYVIRSKAILEANKMLERYDSDKNDRLSEDEAILMADVAFDVGTDDALDAFERVARNEEEIGSSHMEALMESLRETALDQAGEKIKEIDMDGDGLVNFDELRRHFRKKKPSLLKKLIKKVDINKDSSLDLSEWVTLVTEMSRLKKRKAKSDHIIHVRPTTGKEFNGAARDDDGVIRRKRTAEGDCDDDEVLQLSEWDGVTLSEEPAKLIPKNALKFAIMNKEKTSVLKRTILKES